MTLTEKETYRISRSVNDGDPTKFTYDVIEFDSVTNNYIQVRKYMSIGTDSVIEFETQRKIIDPIIRNESIELRSEDWNNLSKLLSKASFWEMYPADSTPGFDGHHFILETHSENGYYVVDRWSPDSGEFKTIVDYLIGLSTYKD